MKNVKKALALLLTVVIAVSALGITVFAGLIENNTAAGTVLWAGYEQDIDGITVTEGTLPAGADNTVYVIAKKGANNTPSKIQLRSTYGTMTFARKNGSVQISNVTYNDTACELWTIARELEYDTYLAVAKYVAVPLADIPVADGASFTVAAPAAPVLSDDVYSIEIAERNADGKIVFDGITEQTITVKTGVDVIKVQLQTNATDPAKRFTMTYNGNNATITDGTYQDAPCLVWTITRLFGKGQYSFSVNVRTLSAGLKDSGVDLDFEVIAAPIAKLVSATVAYPEFGKAVFTVVTADNATKVKFTNTDPKDKGTITIKEGHAWAQVADNGNGSKTWTITLNFAPGMEFNYDIAACVGAYSDPINLDVKMPKPETTTAIS